MRKLGITTSVWLSGETSVEATAARVRPARKKAMPSGSSAPKIRTPPAPPKEIGHRDVQEVEPGGDPGHVQGGEESAGGGADQAHRRASPTDHRGYQPENRHEGALDGRQFPEALARRCARCANRSGPIPLPRIILGMNPVKAAFNPNLLCPDELQDHEDEPQQQHRPEGDEACALVRKVARAPRRPRPARKPRIRGLARNCATRGGRRGRSLPPEFESRLHAARGLGFPGPLCLGHRATLAAKALKAKKIAVSPRRAWRRRWRASRPSRRA